MKTLTVLSLLISLQLPAISGASVLVDKIAAVVNNEIITLSELEKETAKANELSEEKVDKRFILERLIDEKVLNMAATKQGISISDEELDYAMDQVKSQFGTDEEAIQEELKKQNITEEDLRDQIKTQMLTRRLIDTEMQGRIAITEDEILEYYRTNYGEVEYGSQVRIAHILIPFDEKDSYVTAVKVSKEAQSGEDFSRLAREYSKDSVSASNGGDLGYFKKGDLMFEIESVVENMNEGDITDPIETSAGYHIVKVLEKRETSQASLGGYREQIKQAIYNRKSQEFLKDWVDKRREDVFVDIKI